MFIGIGIGMTMGTGQGSGDPPPAAAPVIVVPPNLAPVPAAGGQSSLHIGAAAGNPDPAASWMAQIDGWPDQTGTGGGLIVWPEVSADTAWTVTVSWANGVGDPASVTLTGTIIADTPEPPAEWQLTGGAGEIIITDMPSVPALNITGGAGSVTIED